jgi:hypothetical protein
MTQTVILRTDRTAAHRIVDAAPSGSELRVSAPKRSEDANRLMWALLSDVSRAKPEGRNLPPEVWKCVFMSAVGHQCRFEPSLDGKGVVPIGFKSSRLNKAEFSDLIEAIFSYAAEHQIPLSEQREAA